MGQTDGRTPDRCLTLTAVDAVERRNNVCLCGGALVGPCSLEYTKMKIADHYWTDPTASELIQRHRIHSSARQHGLLQRGGSPQRPALRVTRPVKPSFHDADTDTDSPDTPRSLRPTRAIV